ncbi:Tetraspanin family, putative [Trypanosoma equiperdum]|uniref:Uncharacterized protein n=2 Tax=Trypanozoon TaxID=39700 RepID=Q57U87_TRYB2|nr:hypothetical protein, conserved [Trypanosoma brucei brucei TREU927]AAX70832.1 hypothetical protein, conserved [Trypanosoma brucei]AAZ11490.1 hypothetical protein, conserved [Trypanosoma brucei brucei TREU927]SCU65461.1 Tetraspanin family, putative [Trypanosoma equiperdum]
MKVESPHSNYQPLNSEEGRWFHRIRNFIMGINVFLMAFAVSGLVVGFIELDEIDSAIREICSSCQHAHVIYMSSFGALLLLSFLGFVALHTRKRCLRILNTTCLVLVFIPLVFGSVLYVLMSTEHINMQYGWNLVVAERSDDMCKLELQWKCSGWNKLCATHSTIGLIDLKPLEGTEKENIINNLSVVTNTTSYCSGADEICACPICTEDDQKYIDKFDQTCEMVVMGALRSHLIVFLFVSLCVVVLTGAGIVVSVAYPHAES